jgi:hypothetical protein
VRHSAHNSSGRDLHHATSGRDLHATSGRDLHATSGRDLNHAASGRDLHRATLFFPVSSEGPPNYFKSPLTTNKGMLRAYSNPYPFWDAFRLDCFLKKANVLGECMNVPILHFICGGTRTLKAHKVKFLLFLNYLN